MTKLIKFLEGRKTYILSFATAVINLLQVFNITNLSEDQILAVNALLATLIALAIRDTIVRK
jgi:hypothetical protein